MVESIFDFDEKFGIDSIFGNWTKKKKSKPNDFYPNTENIIIESGPGWKGSEWEKVYKVLRKKSKTYNTLILPYAEDKTFSYVLQSTNDRGNSKNATSSTTIDLSMYKRYSSKQEMYEFLEKYMPDGFKPKFHIKSDFFDNEKNKTLNNLGRAINLIHEAAHVHQHYGQDDFSVSIHKQHYKIQTDYIHKIQKALKEYDSSLRENEIFILSMAGLTEKDAGGAKLIIEYAAKILNQTIKSNQKNKIEAVLELYKSDYKKLTEAKKED